MPTENEPGRPPPGIETKRPGTSHATGAAPDTADVTESLDWQTFSAAYFPGRRRHDLEALIAYGAYRGLPA